MNLICEGGWENDSNSKHWVSKRRICGLYGIDESQTQESTIGVNYTHFYLPLRPDGDYSLATVINEQLETEWKPLWKKQATEKYTKATFLQRLKFLFTKEI